MSATAGRSPAPGLILALLTAVYALSYLDRQMIGLVLDPLKAALRANDAQMGLLAGPSFAIFYGGLGLPLAALAGRIGVRRVIGGSLGLFAAATCACAGVGGYGSLLALRMAVGVGEAGTTPASHALIADLYPPSKRPRALAVWTLGAQLGVLAGFLLAAVVVARFGWRGAFLVAGLPGALLAPVLWRRLPDLRPAGPRRGVLADARRLWAIPAYRGMVAGLACVLFALNAEIAWISPFLHRGFGLPASRAAVIVGLSVGGLGAATTLAAGWLGARAAARGRRARLGCVVIFVVLSGLLWTASLMQTHIEALLCVLPLALATGAAFQGPFYALLQDVVPEEARITAVAMALLVGNVVGAGCGPLAAGATADLLRNAGGAQALATALQICNLANLPALAAFALAARTLRARR